MSSNREKKGGKTPTRHEGQGKRRRRRRRRRSGVSKKSSVCCVALPLSPCPPFGLLPLTPPCCDWFCFPSPILQSVCPSLDWSTSLLPLLLFLPSCVPPYSISFLVCKISPVDFRYCCSCSYRAFISFLSLSIPVFAI